MRFLNVNIDNVTFDEALHFIDQRVESGMGGYVVTPNLDHIIQIEKNQEFCKAYQQASLVLTDGVPMLWISKWLHKPIKEKVSGSDLFPRLCELSAKRGYRMYFLGASPGVADTAADKMKEQYPGLKVVGTFSPKYGFEKNPEQLSYIFSQIHAKQPDILIAALGTPKQELFLYHHQDELKGILSFGLGASLDFASGNSKRAPKWMQKHGLEWFYRVCREPGRLWKRYFMDGIQILPIVWKYRKASDNEDCN